jgi:UPF0716 protein FxsA
MILLFFLFFVVAPLVELYVAVWAASQLGVGPALLTMLIAAVLGIVVMRRAWRRRPRTPDSALLWTAGLLLLLPGFISDVIGLLLLFPPVRAVIRVWVGIRLERSLEQWNVRLMRWSPLGQGWSQEQWGSQQLGGQLGGQGPVIRGEVVDDDDETPSG